MKYDDANKMRKLIQLTEEDIKSFEDSNSGKTSVFEKKTVR